MIKIESGNNMNKRVRIPIIKKKKRLQLLVTRTITRTPEQYKEMTNTMDVRIQGHQKRPNECVCKRKGARA